MIYKNDIHYRKKKLLEFLVSIQNHEDEIVTALKLDFKKSEFETYLTEINFVLSELKITIKSIHKWAKPRPGLHSLLNFPSTDYVSTARSRQPRIISP